MAVAAAARAGILPFARNRADWENPGTAAVGNDAGEGMTGSDGRVDDNGGNDDDGCEPNVSGCRAGGAGGNGAGELYCESESYE